MAELLIELRSEEIPARMQKAAAEQLARRLAALVHGLGFAKIGEDDIATFATPRRIAGVVRKLPAQQPDVVVERRGPRIDAPPQAIDGFLRANGLASVEQCERRDTGKGVFYFHRLKQPGRPTDSVLADPIAELIRAFEWPKSMRWATTAQRWVRPLQSVVCVFDGKTVAGEVDFGSATSAPAERLGFGNVTAGHRFIAPKPFSVRGFADYRRKLAKRFVLLDAADRRSRIETAVNSLAAAEGLRLRPDHGLLDELAGLVEWPVVLLASIDPSFMDLPVEVLTTSMRAHQRYLALETADGRLAPRFVVVANTEADDGGQAIVAGNERVLRARLADARFFWDQDKKQPLASRVPALKDIVFHAKLGSLHDKVERVAELARFLATSIPASAPELAHRAALLAKADLTTGVVGEFPELQGIMGRYYALADGEPLAVAEAVAEHYAPLGPNERCPVAPVSVAVALADKLDTLVGFFAVGEKPTGSKDPFALRRAALGAIRLILENGIRIRLNDAFDAAAKRLAHAQTAATGERPLNDELLAFFADRLKVILREKGIRHDLIDAAFGAIGGEDDMVRLIQRAEALARFLETDDGANLLVAYRRAANILRIEEKKDGTSYDRLADPGHFRQSEEERLFQSIAELASRSDPMLAEGDFAGAMAMLAGLRTPVDAFFDRVTVNADEPDLRRNRLSLLSQIRVGMDAIADFSKIEG
ncbi:MAG: glycine--tRNA ligase subunit beta [Proteobacteria bacterium]|nr:glycine--tRNA ligase subunit beta [Pseudomonadota bacterium]MBI3497886.1 glycine--tRNA ligase subunit beta [Pseudomonadota bacterium]